MSIWSSDDELFLIAERELFSCVVGDVMDKLGLAHQFLPPQIRPLSDSMIAIGRAMPVLSGDVFAEKVENTSNSLSAKPFGLMLEALDDLRRNEIYVNTGSSPRNAMWGEMMSTRAEKLGARGAILNGYVRDTRGILRMNFPTFSFGSYGQIRHRAARVFPLQAFLSRLFLFQGFMHSDESPTTAARLERRGETDALKLVASIRPETKVILNQLINKLTGLLRKTGLLPLTPLMREGEPGRGFHTGSSFPMQPQPSGFGSDLLGRPAGLKRIHVVDSSVLPSIPATTVTFTVMANAHRIGTLVGQGKV